SRSLNQPSCLSACTSESRTLIRFGGKFFFYGADDVTDESWRGRVGMLLGLALIFQHFPLSVGFSLTY
ncbi:MAG TPA: hypothetical protein VLA60_11890, partial [Nitrospirales bacterium]|nr:hypothetical protein [Nitrospirales bacterium]